ncbi:MAG: hypothetical protein V3W09_03045 [Nitrososphaerales archaeon]
MVLQTLINALYSPNVWQNRLVDELGLLVVVGGVVAVVIHFVVRHIRPPIKEEH